MTLPVRFLIGVGCGVALLMVTAVSLRLAGRLKPYSVPTRGMAPAICPGDRIVAEGLSLFWREPVRGEMVVFDASAVPALGSTGAGVGAWIQRVVALPGDRCQIKEGSVWINGAKAPELSGRRYSLISGVSGFSGPDLSKEVTVPPNQYIVLGDNTQNSLDSRYWGSLPRSSIKLVYLCHYWRSADRSTTRPSR